MSAPGPPRRPPLPAGLGPGPPGIRRRVPTAPSPHRACRRWSRRAATARVRPGRGHRGAHAAAPLPNAGKQLRGLVRAGGKNSWPRASPATGLPPLPPPPSPRYCPSGPPAAVAGPLRYRGCRPGLGLSLRHLRLPVGQWGSSRRHQRLLLLRGARRPMLTFPGSWGVNEGTARPRAATASGGQGEPRGSGYPGQPGVGGIKETTTEPRWG